jgi:hypothetical protein
MLRNQGLSGFSARQPSFEPDQTGWVTMTAGSEDRTGITAGSVEVGAGRGSSGRTNQRAGEFSANAAARGLTVQTARSTVKTMDDAAQTMAVPFAIAQRPA